MIFFKIHKKLVSENVNIVLDDAVFDCDYKPLGFIKQSGYIYKLEGALKDKLLSFLKKYKYILVGLTFMFSIIYINSYRYEKIVFNTSTPINSKIEEDLNSKA